MKKKWICLLTALTLIVGVCVAEPILGEAVSPDLEKTDCSMTIFPENPEKPAGSVIFGEDLEKVAIEVDIYKVADAIKIPGYDSYTYDFNDKYTELKKILTALGDKKLTASDWQELAQAAAKDVLEGGSENGQPAAGIEKTGTVSIKTPQEDLKTGLYLLIARGSSMEKPEDYRVVMKGKSHLSEMDGDIATIANSNKYTYIFAPQLISLPMRDAKVSGDGPDSENGPLPGFSDDYMTSDPGDWVYDLNVYLKPVRVGRYGSLKISKKLQTYESEEDVLLPGEEGAESATPGSIGQDEKTTFVFKATWDDEGKQISKVDSLTFPIIKENGEKVYDWQLYMDDIPVGAVVTVEEIYSGASYGIVGSGKQTVTIGKGTENIKNGIAILDEKDAVIKIISSEGDNSDGERTEVGASVAFTNNYNRNQRKGYGINNEFAYDDEGTPGWKWIMDGADQNIKIPVDTTVGGGNNDNNNTDNPDDNNNTDNPDDNNNTDNNSDTDVNGVTQ